MELFEFFETDTVAFCLHENAQQLSVVIKDGEISCSNYEQLFHISLGDFYKIASPGVIEAFECHLARDLTCTLEIPSETGKENGPIDLETALAELTAVDVSSVTESEQFARTGREEAPFRCGRQAFKGMRR